MYAASSKRALIGGEGRCIVYAGIDAGVPVGAPGTAGLPALSPGDAAGIDHDDTSGPDLVRHTPERVRDAVRAAFEGGAAGIILGEKYAQMRLEALDGVRAAFASA